MEVRGVPPLVVVYMLAETAEGLLASCCCCACVHIASSRNWRESRDVDRRDIDRRGNDYDNSRYRNNSDESGGRRIEYRRPRMSGSAALDEDWTQGRLSPQSAA